eukprot:Nk52_evm4s228 gene=Nk52_evmTU4s228
MFSRLKDTIDSLGDNSLSSGDIFGQVKKVLGTSDENPLNGEGEVEKEKEKKCIKEDHIFEPGETLPWVVEQTKKASTAIFHNIGSNESLESTEQDEKLLEDHPLKNKNSEADNTNPQLEERKPQRPASPSLSVELSRKGEGFLTIKSDHLGSAHTFESKKLEEASTKLALLTAEYGRYKRNAGIESDFLSSLEKSVKNQLLGKDRLLQKLKDKIDALNNQIQEFQEQISALQMENDVMADKMNLDHPKSNTLQNSSMEHLASLKARISELEQVVAVREATISQLESKVLEQTEEIESMQGKERESFNTSKSIEPEAPLHTEVGETERNLVVLQEKYSKAKEEEDLLKDRLLEAQDLLKYASEERDAWKEAYESKEANYEKECSLTAELKQLYQSALSDIDALKTKPKQHTQNKLKQMASELVNMTTDPDVREDLKALREKSFSSGSEEECQLLYLDSLSEFITELKATNDVIKADREVSIKELSKTRLSLSNFEYQLKELEETHCAQEKLIASIEKDRDAKVEDLEAKTKELNLYMEQWSQVNEELGQLEFENNRLKAENALLEKRGPSVSGEKNDSTKISDETTPLEISCERSDINIARHCNEDKENIPEKIISMENGLEATESERTVEVLKEMISVLQEDLIDARRDKAEALKAKEQELSNILEERSLNYEAEIEELSLAVSNLAEKLSNTEAKGEELEHLKEQFNTTRTEYETQRLEMDASMTMTVDEIKTLSNIEIMKLRDDYQAVTHSLEEDLRKAEEAQAESDAVIEELTFRLQEKEAELHSMRESYREQFESMSISFSNQLKDLMNKHDLTLDNYGSLTMELQEYKDKLHGEKYHIKLLDSYLEAMKVSHLEELEYMKCHVQKKRKVEVYSSEPHMINQVDGKQVGSSAVYPLQFPHAENVLKDPVFQCDRDVRMEEFVVELEGVQKDYEEKLSQSKTKLERMQAESRDLLLERDEVNEKYISQLKRCEKLNKKLENLQHHYRQSEKRTEELQKLLAPDAREEIKPVNTDFKEVDMSTSDDSKVAELTRRLEILQREKNVLEEDGRELRTLLRDNMDINNNSLLAQEELKQVKEKLELDLQCALGSESSLVHMATERDALFEELQEQKQRNNHLNIELSDLEEQHSKLATIVEDHTGLKEELVLMETKNDKLQRHIEEQDQERANLHSKLQMASLQLDELQSSNNTLSLELETLNARLVQHRQSASSYSSDDEHTKYKAKEKDDLLFEMSKKQRDTERLLRKSEKEAKEQLKKSMTLTENISSIASEKQKMEDELLSQKKLHEMEMNSKQSEMIIILKEKEHQIENMALEIQEYKSASNAKEDIVIYQKGVSEAEKKAIYYEKEAEKLKGQLGKANHITVGYQRELHEAKESLRVLEDRCAEYGEEADDFKNHNLDLLQENDDLKDNLLRLEEALKDNEKLSLARENYITVLEKEVETVTAAWHMSEGASQNANDLSETYANVVNRSLVQDNQALKSQTDLLKTKIDMLAQENGELWVAIDSAQNNNTVEKELTTDANVKELSNILAHAEIPDEDGDIDTRALVNEVKLLKASLNQQKTVNSGLVEQNRICSYAIENLELQLERSDIVIGSLEADIQDLLPKAEILGNKDQLFDGHRRVDQDAIEFSLQLLKENFNFALDCVAYEKELMSNLGDARVVGFEDTGLSHALPETFEKEVIVRSDYQRVAKTLLDEVEALANVREDIVEATKISFKFNILKSNFESLQTEYEHQRERHTRIIAINDMLQKQLEQEALKSEKLQTSLCEQMVLNGSLENQIQEELLADKVELNSVKHQLESCQEELKKSKEERSMREKDHQELREELDAVCENLRQKEMELSFSQEGTRNIEQEYQTELDNLIADIKVTEEQKSELLDTKLQQDEAIHTLNTKNARLEYELKRVQSDNQDKQAIIASCESENEALKAQLQDSEQEIASTFAKYRQIETTSDEVRLALSDSQSNFNSVSSEVQSLRHALENAERDLCFATTKVTELQQVNEGLSSDKTAAALQAQEYTRAMELKTMKEQHQNNKIDELEKQVEELKKLEHKSAEVEELNSKIRRIRSRSGSQVSALKQIISDSLGPNAEAILEDYCPSEMSLQEMETEFSSRDELDNVDDFENLHIMIENLLNYSKQLKVTNDYGKEHIRKLEGIIMGHEQNITQLRQHYDSLVKELDKKIEFLQGQLAKLEDKTIPLQMNVEKYESALKSANEEIGALKFEVLSANDKYKESQIEAGRLAEALELKDTLICQLQSEKGETELKDGSSAIISDQPLKATNSAEWDSLLSELEECRDELNAEREESERNTNIIEGLNVELAECIAEKNKLLRKVAFQNSELSDTSLQLKEAQDQVKELNSTIQSVEMNVEARKDLSAELIVKDKEISALENALAELQKEHDSFSSQHSKTSESLSETISSLNRELADYQKQLIGKGEEILELNHVIKSLGNTISSQQISIEKQKEALNAVGPKAEESMAVIRRQSTQLQLMSEKLDALQEESNQAREKYDTQCRLSTATEETLESLRDKYDKLEKDYANSIEIVTKQDSELVLRQNMISRYESNNKKSILYITELETKVDDLSDQLKQKEREVERLEEKCNRIVQDNQDMGKSIAQSDDRVVELSNQLQDVQKLEAEVREREEEVAALQMRVKTLEEDIENDATSKRQLEEALASKDNEIYQLKESIETQKESLLDQSQEINRLKQQNQDIGEDIAQSNVRVMELSNQLQDVQKMEAEVWKREEEVTALHGHVKALEEDIEYHATIKSQLEGALSSKDNEVDELRDAIEMQKMTLTEQLQEIDCLKQQNQEMGEDIAQSNDRVVQLSNQLQDVPKLEAEVREREEEVAALQMRVKTLEEDIENDATSKRQLEEVLASKDNEIYELKDSIETQKGSLLDQSQEIDHLKQQLMLPKQNSGDLKQLAQAAEKIMQLETLVCELEQKVKNSEELESIVETQKGQLQNYELEKQVPHREADVALTRRLAQQEEFVEQLKTLVQQQEIEIAGLRKKNTTLSVSSDMTEQLQYIIEQQEDEISTLKCDVARSNTGGATEGARIEEMKRIIEDQQSDIETIRDELEEKELALESKEARVSGLVQECNALRKAADDIGQQLSSIEYKRRQTYNETEDIHNMRRRIDYQKQAIDSLQRQLATCEFEKAKCGFKLEEQIKIFEMASKEYEEKIEELADKANAKKEEHVAKLRLKRTSTIEKIKLETVESEQKLAEIMNENAALKRKLSEQEMTGAITNS